MLVNMRTPHCSGHYVLGPMVSSSLFRTLCIGPYGVLLTVQDTTYYGVLIRGIRSIPGDGELDLLEVEGG